MFVRISLIFLLLATVSMASFIGLTPYQLQDKIDKNIVVIDIRTPPEWSQTGTIPTAHKLMFFDSRGGYNIESWLKEFKKLVKDENQPFVLVCRSGNRTEQVGSFLSKKLNYKNVFHLKHGIKLWIRESRKVTK